MAFGLTLAFAPRIDIAVLMAVAMAIAHHLRREQRLVYQHWVDASGLHLRPQGVLWFGSAPGLEDKLLSLLIEHPDTQVLKLHLDGLGRIDLSAAMMLNHVRTERTTIGH